MRNFTLLLFICAFLTVFSGTAQLTITCPPDINHACDESPDYGLATAESSCSVVALTYTDVETGNSCQNIITRTWTAVDDCDNENSCVQTIEIVDVSPPVITGEAELTLPSDSDPNSFIAIAIEDNCNDFSITYIDEWMNENQTIIRTYVVTDFCGNQSNEFTQIMHIEASGSNDDCSDELACNYNPDAEGSSDCLYVGDSCDVYTFQVYQEDCSCPEYNPGDFDGDSLVSILDLRDLLVFARIEFVESNTDIEMADHNNDGLIDAQDVLSFLTIFGALYPLN